MRHNPPTASDPDNEISHVKPDNITYYPRRVRYATGSNYDVGRIEAGYRSLSLWVCTAEFAFRSMCLCELEGESPS